MAMTSETRSRAARRGHVARAPVGVVDIGSNSVRLVVYDGISRAPSVVFNEKALCAIGRNMVSTGKLDPDGIARALEALARFAAIADGLGVVRIEAAATAAARDAANGPEFVKKGEQILGAPIRILSGEEEARIAAEGVQAAIPDADGMVADLGGGSLDVVSVSRGRIGRAGTLPFGPLRLMDLSAERIEKARAIVDEGLERLPGLDRMKGRTLYAVGGIWRNFARVHMADARYPLHVLQNYTITREQTIRLASVLAGQSRKSLERIREIPRRRIEAMPFGAVVLERLVKAGAFRNVVISAYGLREGLYFRLVPEELRGRDPLLEAARELNERTSRAPAHTQELMTFIAPLFQNEGADQRRLREAACLLSDIQWRGHPDYRATGAFWDILQAPWIGLDHAGRVRLAHAVFVRYADDEDPPERADRLLELIDGDDRRRSESLGLAMRLGYALSGSAPGVLAHAKLAVRGGDGFVLQITKARQGVVSEVVGRRLAALAASLRRTAKIELV